MTKTTNLSRREREEQQQTRRYMLFGGAAFAVAAAAGIGVTMIPPSFPKIDGTGTMKARITDIDLNDYVVRLTPKSDADDIMVIGTTDCSYCRAFVEDGLENLVAFAKENNLGLVYGATGASKASLGSSQLISVLANDRKADAAAVIKAVYDNSTKLNADDGIQTVAKNIGETLGLTQAVIAASIAADPVEVTRKVQTLGRAFPVRGTPIFFVANSAAPEAISWFSGWVGSSGLHRQIIAARSA